MIVSGPHMLLAFFSQTLPTVPHSTLVLMFSINSGEITVLRLLNSCHCHPLQPDRAVSQAISVLHPWQHHGLSGAFPRADPGPWQCPIGVTWVGSIFFWSSCLRQGLEETPLGGREDPTKIKAKRREVFICFVHSWC